MTFFTFQIVFLTGVACICACSYECGDKNSIPSTCEKPKPTYTVVDYDYVKKATEDNNKLIIDVREDCEVKNGKIPNSINISVGTFDTALGPMSESEFLETYQRPKPGKDDEIIIYCKIGKRSTIISKMAIDLGYTNVKNYVGSWREWSSKTQN